MSNGGFLDSSSLHSVWMYRLKLGVSIAATCMYSEFLHALFELRDDFKIEMGRALKREGKKRDNSLDDISQLPAVQSASAAKSSFVAVAFVCTREKFVSS